MKKSRNRKLKKVTSRLNAMKSLWIPFAALIIIVTGSCRSSPSVTSIPTIQEGESLSNASSSNGSGPPIQPINTPDFSGIPTPSSNMDQFVKIAKQDLADRLKINSNEISLLKITKIDWQDIAQGCSSAPDKTMLKGKITGYRVWLEVDDKDYVLHVGLDGTVIFCLN